MPSSPAIPVDTIEAAKQASTAQLLFRVSRLVNDRSLARLRAATGHEIRAAHTNLFPHLDLDGTRLTVLAARVGVSKQAVGQLVDELEHMGALERVPDPKDGRAKLIRFAQPPDGEHGILAGLRILGEVESELETHVGAETWRGLRSALLALLPILESGSNK